MLQLFLKEYLEAGVVGVLLVFNAVLGVTQPTLARWFGAARRSLKSQLRCVAVGLAAYAYSISMPIAEFIPLLLIAVLATAPVALLATFTLATALSAQKLARLNVLPICLSAIDKAASMNVLSSDKTGTLTRNELAVTAVHAFPDRRGARDRSCGARKLGRRSRPGGPGGSRRRIACSGSTDAGRLHPV